MSARQVHRISGTSRPRHANRKRPSFQRRSKSSRRRHPPQDGPVAAVIMAIFLSFDHLGHRLARIDIVASASGRIVPDRPATKVVQPARGLALFRRDSCSRRTSTVNAGDVLVELARRSMRSDRNHAGWRFDFGAGSRLHGLKAGLADTADPLSAFSPAPANATQAAGCHANANIWVRQKTSEFRAKIEGHWISSRDQRNALNSTPFRPPSEKLSGPWFPLGSSSG